MTASDPCPAATVQRTAQEPPLLPPAVRQALERPGPFALGLDAWLAAECGATRPEGLAAAVRARQLELLNADLCHMATHSPLYRQRLTGAGRWSAAGLRPLRDLAELAELPFTTADDLRPGEALLCVSRDEVARMVTVSTSGSTGAPKRLAFSDTELARTRDFFAVGMAQMVTAGQHVAVLLPGAHRPRGITDLLAGSLAPQGVRVTARMELADLLLCAPEQAPEGAALRLEAVRTAWQALASTAPAGLALVLLPRQMGCLWRAFPQTPPGLCAALCAADWLDPGLRRQVEQSWDCPVLDHYGSTESAFAGAVQCRCREGRHVRALDLLLEIVHPVTGEVLPAGETGELVITTLQRRAMPLLRYRTGDMASLLDGPCACGSPLPRLGPVLGRIECDGRDFRVTHPRKGGSEERRPCAITL